MNHRFLYIFSTENHTFESVLAQVLKPYGRLDTCLWDDLEMHSIEDYTLIFLDAGIIADTAESDNLTSIISLIQKYSLRANIIVATTSPTWRRAKEAFQAGAVDYIHLTLDTNRLNKDMEAVINTFLSATENKDDLDA